MIWLGLVPAMLPHVKRVYSWSRTWRRREGGWFIWNLVWCLENRHVMYKENYIHLDCSNVLYFLFPLSRETLSQDTGTSEKDLGNMPSLLLLRAGSFAPCIKDSRIKLKGKSTGQLKLKKPRYAKSFLSRGKHFSLTYTLAGFFCGSIYTMREFWSVSTVVPQRTAVISPFWLAWCSPFLGGALPLLQLVQLWHHGPGWPRAWLPSAHGEFAAIDSMLVAWI